MMNYQSNKNNFFIHNRRVGDGQPTYFIADIAANHDGDLARALKLIDIAAKSGADAAKFQHFKAETIVSDFGFKSLGKQQSHQARWKKSVFDVYQEASLNLDWTPYLKKACDEAGIAFFTSPYAINIIDAIDPYVPAYKIGSGDITWIEIIEYIAAKNKPYILATGASCLSDVDRAVQAGLKINPNLALLQCNTNYTGSLDNFAHIQLRVLQTFRERYPEVILGLSDHTPGHTTVLGAVTLGATIIEKHFTDDTSRTGPDHAFSMNPTSWREMVDRTRELEASLGSGNKQVEDNEIETLVLQRRAIRASEDMLPGTILSPENLIMLRPCPKDAIPPYESNNLIGRQLKVCVQKGDLIRWKDLE